MIKQLCLALFGLLLITSTPLVQGQNCLTEVMQQIYDMGNQLSVAGRGYFIFGQRENAIITIAIHDALNTISQDYDFYLGPAEPVGMSNGHIKHAHDCAAVVAAYVFAHKNNTLERRDSNSNLPYVSATVSAQFIQTLTDFYESKISEYRSQLNNGQQKRIDDAIKIGELSAHNILENRYNDGFKATVPEPNPPAGLGKWSRLPGTTRIDYPHWANVRTFVLSGPQEFLVAPPPSIDDPVYLADLEQTKYLGGRDSQTAGNRTLANSDSARWWNGASNAHVGFVLIALQQRLQWDLRKTVAAFTILSIAGADQNIAVFNQKGYYLFWRPQHAIKNQANLDYTGHPGLQALQDPNWFPFLITPNNPEYPAGHPTNTGSACLTMKSFFGFDAFPGGAVTVNYFNPPPGAPVPPQTFTSFTDIQMNVRMARIYGGMHLLHSCMVGEGLAIPIAAKAVARIRSVEE
jgi:hypothetical protein